MSSFYTYECDGGCGKTQRQPPSGLAPSGWFTLAWGSMGAPHHTPPPQNLIACSKACLAHALTIAMEGRPDG